MCIYIYLDSSSRKWINLHKNSWTQSLFWWHLTDKMASTVSGGWRSLWTSMITGQEWSKRYRFSIAKENKIWKRKQDGMRQKKGSKSIEYNVFWSTKLLRNVFIEMATYAIIDKDFDQLSNNVVHEVSTQHTKRIFSLIF